MTTNHHFLTDEELSGCMQIYIDLGDNKGTVALFDTSEFGVYLVGLSSIMERWPSG